MSFRILSCAEQELVEAVDYYNGQCPGLGFEFAAEVKKTFVRINDYPQAWPLISKRVHRCILNRFPYGVLYQIRKDEIIVIAIMHVKRDPAVWQNRLAALN